MKVSISRTGIYIPKWNGNRDLPTDEQITVEFSYLSFDERRRFIKRTKPVITITDPEKKTDAELDAEINEQHTQITMTVDADDNAIAAAMKPIVKNLEDTDGNPISVWADILKAPQLSGLADEIINELSKSVGETDSKNLK